MMLAASGCELLVSPDREKISGAGGAGGSAPSCTAPETLCGTECVDTKDDPTNCGACGTKCGSSEVCTAG
ncbi:MAG: hypothetical protein FJ095_19930, partial [Deltaproteobacteria bacterium]|nr:hypothetical protein [Deltaproteobacteria bacterium]